MSASQFPPLEAKQSTKRCTNCSSLMSLYTLPGHYSRTLDIDVCKDCNAIWFDQWESSQLSPDGVVALFQLIHERGGTASSASGKLSEGLRCVTCGDGMKLMNDRVKNTRFVYQSCRNGHGRFTTFYNFLAEKQFVRELTQAERAKLCATVKQVKCSGCAAPVDLAKTDACEYCRAPVSVFDRDAAKKAIDHYLRERQKQLPVTPLPNYGHFPRDDRRDQRGWDTWDTLYAADIATDLLWALGRAASRGFGRTVAPAAAGMGAGAVLADAGSAVGAPLSNVPGGLMDSLGAGTGAPLATATDLLFSDAANASAGLASGTLSTATDAFAAGSGGGLASATDALFGSGAGSASELFGTGASGVSDFTIGAIESVSSASSAAGDVASGAFDAASSGLSDSVGDFASDAGEGVADLVSDGIGSFISSIFD